jgi:tetratricopeptide (TPR) repeat protein
LLHALAELPVTALTSNAIAAMLPRSRRADAIARPLEELRIRNLVQENEGRYRLRTEIRRAIVRTRDSEDRRAIACKAVPALLRHYVERTERWAARLESGSVGAEAADWFRDAELSLRPLFSQESYLDEKLVAAVTGELAKLADALEVWYLREQTGGLLEVGEGLQALAVRADRPELACLAAIRMAAAYRMKGSLGKAGEMLEIATAHAARTGDERTRAELDVREHIERAMLCLAAGTGLPAAEAELDRVLASRRSGADRATTAILINLGALCLRQNRPEVALEHLRRAERLAGPVRDIGCEAQAIELQGVAMAQQRGELHEVVPLWQRANGLFVQIGDKHGEGRCLQHLGSAALGDPVVAGRLRDGHPTALSEREAAEVALPLLKRSKLLRAGQPDTSLVDSYLELARKRLGLAESED